MIFTQRFFTALLGLLFASVLTDQASALYDPGVGRFCSRDPIGYGGVNCLTCLNWPLIQGAPNVKYEIVAIPANYTPPKDSYEGCGVRINAKWNFTLSPHPPDQTPGKRGKPCNNGFEGYLIQKVTTKCGLAKCKKGCGCKEPKGMRDLWNDPDFDHDHYQYWETWNVTPEGVVTGKNVDDIGKFKTIQNSCGYHHQFGELRYFCKEDVDVNLKELGDVGTRHGRLEECKVTSGGLPSTGNEPSIWSSDKVKAKGVPLDKDGFNRFVSANWGCCPPQKDKWVQFDWEPKLK